MTPIQVLADIKVWILLGIVLAAVFGFDGDRGSTLMVVVLIVQMTLSLDGLEFKKDDFGRYRRGIAMHIIGCFAINTAGILLTGLLFMGDRALWCGFVMLASVPCAVSVVMASMIMEGDTKEAVIGLTAIYVVAVAATPLMTDLLIGDAVSPFEILKYILLFVAVPFVLRIPLKRLRIPRTPKVIAINILMMLLMFIGLGSRMEYVRDDTALVLLVFLAQLIRVFITGFAVLLAAKRKGIRREASISMMCASVWKNSGLSASMAMVLLGTTMPEAMIPCIMSVVAECVWFAIMTGLLKRTWPRGPPGTSPRSTAE